MLITGPRSLKGVAVVLLLGFLLLTGLPPALSEKSLVHAHFAVLLCYGLQGSDCGRLLNRVGKTYVDWVESL